MSEETIVEALKAAAHPVRFRILRALSGKERNVGEIDAVAQIGQPTLSQQLAVLRNTGLVQTRKEAKLVFYRLDEEKIAELSATLGGLVGLEAEGGSSARRPASGVASFARLT
ncbi:transcriptional regulator [Erythrobacter sp. QSSC1-22B]|uniref:ArsR/SmtB family transcription factor n=1 Tax=Erythrobacter sp. QSSC1-22B TaxID=1860125 RepID=UPI0008052BAE|nr:metalloregulator ArsR/SmtB family transcription factor [Erythrobacter sp. QSSC1-22B]OBX18589.1 transcriptional regulator [Erythrobacter sp. QSSC1-22B]